MAGGVVCVWGRQVQCECEGGGIFFNAPVLHRQLDGDTQALPVLGGLGDVITDLLGRQTKGTDLGGKGGRGTNFTTHGTEVHWEMGEKAR
jgi:hypothetical protein